MGWQDRHYNRESQPGFGGGLATRLSGSSVVTWLLGINFAVFVVDMILAGGGRTASLGIAPSAWGAFTVDQGLFGFQVWRWFTYQFLHANFFHLLFNMIGLFFFGPLMEQWWGSRRFLAFYLLCGMCGAVLYTALVLIMPGVIFPAELEPYAGLVPLVGASGAIFGILAGCAVKFPHHRVMLLIPPIPMSMRTMALIFLGIAFFSILAGTQNAGGQAAHLGGAAVAALLVLRPQWLDWADRIGGSRHAPSRPGLRERWQEKRQQRNRQQQADEDAEVDRILEKVKNQGLQSLSGREKRTLSRATERRRGG